MTPKGPILMRRELGAQGPILIRKGIKNITIYFRQILELFVLHEIKNIEAHVYITMIFLNRDRR